METNRRFSLLTFPQFYDGNTLTLNILVLPRNQNPLQDAIILHDGVTFPMPVIPDAPAFADAQLAFEARIISGLDRLSQYPAAGRQPPAGHCRPDPGPGSVHRPGQEFQHQQSEPDQRRPGQLTRITPEKNPAVSQDLSVKKYLPVSYRTVLQFHHAAHAQCRHGRQLSLRGARRGQSARL